MKRTRRQNAERRLLARILEVRAATADHDGGNVYLSPAAARDLAQIVRETIAKREAA